MASPSQGEFIQEDSFSSDEEFDESDVDTESSSDVDEKLAQEDIFDEEFFKCYTALKKKDGKIYDKNVKFFSEQAASTTDRNNEEEDDGGDVSKKVDDNSRELLLNNKELKKPKLTLLDHQLSLKDDQVEEPLLGRPSKSYYEKELDDIKKSIKEVSENVDSESDDDLLVVKGESGKAIDKTSNKLQGAGESHLKQIWSEPDKLTEEEKFLRDYILNKRYIPTNDDNDEDKGRFFSKNLDEMSDAEDEKETKKKKHLVDHHSDEKDFDKIARIPRNSTKTIRDLAEKQKKKEKRLKKLEKEKKRKKALRDADCEDIVGDMPTKFHYIETEPTDDGMTAEELLMLSDEELEKVEKGAKKVVNDKPVVESNTQKKKKKKKRGLSHKKFAKTGVAPDRLLAYGLSKTKLKKSRLL